MRSDVTTGALVVKAVVGSSSLWRKAKLLLCRSDLTVVAFRGNVQTRLRKPSENVPQTRLLAMAGLNRLTLTDMPHILKSADDLRPAGMLAAIHDTPTGQRLAAERAFLATLDGSCQTPIAALAEQDGGRLRLRGEILRLDGAEVSSDEAGGPISGGPISAGPISAGPDLGRDMARRLLDRAGPSLFGR